jgi:hypothetical protein
LQKMHCPSQVIPGPTRRENLVEWSGGSTSLLKKVINPGKLGSCCSEVTRLGNLCKDYISLHCSDLISPCWIKVVFLAKEQGNWSNINRSQDSIGPTLL